MFNLLPLQGHEMLLENEPAWGIQYNCSISTSSHGQSCRSTPSCPVYWGTRLHITGQSFVFTRMSDVACGAERVCACFLSASVGKVFLRFNTSCLRSEKNPVTPCCCCGCWDPGRSMTRRRGRAADQSDGDVAGALSPLSSLAFMFCFLVSPA